MNSARNIEVLVDTALPEGDLHCRGRRREHADPTWRSITVQCPPDRYLVTMTENLRLTIAYEEPDAEGWIVARVIEVPGAVSQGRDRKEARENVIDALRLVLAPDDNDASVAAGRSEQLDLVLSG